MELKFSTIQTEAVPAMAEMYINHMAGSGGAIEYGINLFLIAVVIYAVFYLLKIRRHRREAKRKKWLYQMQQLVNKHGRHL